MMGEQGILKPCFSLRSEQQAVKVIGMFSFQYEYSDLRGVYSE